METLADKQVLVMCSRSEERAGGTVVELPHSKAGDCLHSSDHVSGELHHHHTHAACSVHEHGHHLLQVENLSVGFRMYDSDAPFFKAQQKTVSVIENLSVSVHAGEIVAIVGASGSGKTLLADAIMGLYEPNSQVSGSIWFDGRLQDARSLAQLRGRGLSYVPQSVSYLDPLMKVGRQVQGARGCDYAAGAGESLAPGTHTRAQRHARAARQQELFVRYGLAPEVADLYPHELSGGMARRVLLCCALIENPQVIIADEPTPGLDLNLAVRALDDFRSFADEGGGVMLITHDIELALRVADRVAVFRNGTIVEETAVENFASPDTLRHPFSRALWHALPEHDFACAGCEAEGIANADTAEVAAAKAGRDGVQDAMDALDSGGREIENMAENFGFGNAGGRQ